MALNALFPMIGALAGAGASMFGASQSAQAQNYATNLGYRQLFGAEQQARELLRLSKAPRSDALGTTTGYRGGEWFTDVTPLTQAILNATQAGERKTATEGFARDQQGKQLAASRGGDLDQGFDRDYAEYRYGPRKSERALQSEYGRIAQRGIEEGQDEVARTAGIQAVREGSNPRALEAIMRALMKQRSTNIQDSLIQGQLAGTQAYGQQEANRSNLLARALQQAGLSGGSFNA